MQKKKRHSPFSQEFWVLKGMTPEEADFKRNSMRPIRKEYWILKGFSENEAVKKANETKTNNNIKGALISKNRDPHDIRKSSPRCVEYWMSKGFTLKESELHVSNNQTTFSLKRCIEKYGINNGTARWKKRNIEWQKTINSKPKDEILKINSKKNSVIPKKNETVNCFITRLKNTRGIVLYDCPKKFKLYVQDKLHNNPSFKYIPINIFVSKKIPKVQLTILKFSQEDCCSLLEDFFVKETTYLERRGNKQANRLWTNEGNLLRSSYEIYFYESKIKNYIDLIDQKYKNSKMRFDFKMKNGDYIEICPMFTNCEKYAAKMETKQKQYGCLLLKSIAEIDAYINSYAN